MPALFVVATPIGNLGDMTPRAVEVLKTVGLIAAEDTRVTGKLMNAFDIHTPIVSCHEHNERSRAAEIIGRMESEGIDVAVTTDAGTPCISDPGTVLAAEAIRAGFPVYAVPGPTAMASAISVSGFDAREFAFYGFLPRAKKELREKLLQIVCGPKIAVVHESPHRVAELLETVSEILPHTLVSASCDLTKKYECTLRGPVETVLRLLKENPKSDKGEYCVVLCLSGEDIPEQKTPETGLSLEAQLMDGIVNGLDMKQAAEKLVNSGNRKNAVKAAMLSLKKLVEDMAENE